MRHNDGVLVPDEPWSPDATLAGARWLPDAVWRLPRDLPRFLAALAPGEPPAAARRALRDLLASPMAERLPWTLARAARAWLAARP